MLLRIHQQVKIYRHHLTAKVAIRITTDQISHCDESYSQAKRSLDVKGKTRTGSGHELIMMYGWDGRPNTCCNLTAHTVTLVAMLVTTTLS